MNDSLKQNQRTGDNSTNLQAQRIEVHQHLGLSLAEVKQEFMALFEANFYRLQSIARTTAEQRAIAITERFLAELMQRNPSGLQAADDPDMQAAIFTAQRDYARSGREDLEQVLVDLLVDRATASDLRRIVLNEAIAATSRLTEPQLDTLSFILLFVHQAPIRYSFETLDDFSEHLKRNVVPLIHDELATAATYFHLKSTGCVSMDSGGVSIVHRIEMAFPACFSLGFDPAIVTRDHNMLLDLSIPAFHQPEKLQFKPMDRLTFAIECEKRGVQSDELEFIAERILNVASAAELLSRISPRFDLLTTADERSAMQALLDVQLTTTGIAIGNANLRRRTGQEFDLGTWIR
jgi:hypothetical protein